MATNVDALVWTLLPLGFLALSCTQPAPTSAATATRVAPSPTPTGVPTATLAPVATATPVPAPTPTATRVVASTATPVVAAPSPTLSAPQTVSLKLEESVGVPPPAGWKLAVAEFNTTAQETTDGPHNHDFAWVFVTIAGTGELTAGGSAKTSAAGEAVFIPVRQQHTHRYMPQSKLIGFHLRTADQAAGALHRGTTILLSEQPLELRAGTDYKVRVREYVLGPGVRMSESLTADPNFGYLAAGTVTLTVGQTTTTLEAGKPFVLPHKGLYTLANPGTSPARFILVDVHP